DPDLRYAMDGDVAVPLDYPTLAMFSAYHSFERVMASLEPLTGSSIEVWAAPWPKIDVFFEPRIQSEEGTSIGKLNAFYLVGQKQFGLMQRSELEVVPLGASLLRVAHEFG